MANNQFNGTVIRKKKSNGMLIGVGAAIVVVIILIAAVAILMLNKGKNGSGNRDYIDIANQYVEQMDYSNAVKTYWAAIDAAPKRVDYYVQLGELYEEMDKDETACTVYQMGYERTQSQTLYLKWTTLRDRLGNKENAINKGNGQAPTKQLLLNNDLGDRFAFFTYREYTMKYGTPSVDIQGGRYIARYNGLDADFVYYNTARDQYVVDPVNRKPRDNKRPNEILLHNLALLLTGMEGTLNMSDLTNFDVSNLIKTTDKNYGKKVLLFEFRSATVEIECDDNGNFNRDSWCLVLPSTKTIVQETTTEEESTTDPHENNTTAQAAPETSTTAPETTAPETTTQPPVSTFNVIGYVRNAVDAEGVSNVRLSLIDTAGNAGTIGSTVTDSDGAFRFSDVPVGEYKIRMSRDGFVTDEYSFSVNEGMGDVSLELVMSPELQVGEIRFVLTWNQQPHDLDSHLSGTSGSGSSVHVYWSHKSATDAGNTIAELDVDDTSSYGPETTTLYDMNGVFDFFVEDFDETGTMGVNGATVKIYINGQSPIVVEVPTGVQNRWHVAHIDHGAVTTVNRAAD